jgi:Brp/Blh family beta-carotene 15,15'-monooxygenase
MPFPLHRTVPWICAVVLGLFGFSFPHQAALAAPLFFLASAVILGVPHGACDPWVPGWVQQKPSRIPFLFWFFVVYLSLSFLYLLVWKAVPFGATVFFLFLTAWHWGTADASLLFSPGLRWLSFGLGRGLWVMLAPFAFHTPEAWRVVQLMAPNAGASPSHLLFQGLLLIPLILTLAARPDWTEWGETILLLALLALTPPLVGVGTYFVAFHAWRHLLRLADLRDHLATQADALPWLRSLVRLLWFAVPLTIATLLLLPLLPRFLGPMPQTQEQWVGAYLVLLAVLTLPHAILVGWVDRKTSALKRC